MKKLWSNPFFSKDRKRKANKIILGIDLTIQRKQRNASALLLVLIG
jgi:hypothetical protein